MMQSCLKILFFLLLVAVCINTSAQHKNLFPANTKAVMQIFKEAENLLATDTLQAAVQVQKLDSICNANEQVYKLFIASVRLWQAWYQFSSTKLPKAFAEKGNNYLLQAELAIKGNEQIFLDSFSLDVLNIGLSFDDIHQLSLLASLNKLWKEATGYTYKTTEGDYRLTLYAWFKYYNGDTKIANNLVQYDALYYPTINDKSAPVDQLCYMAYKAITLGHQYKEWKVNKDSTTANNLYNNYKKWSYNCNNWLFKPMVKNNLPNSPNYNKSNRESYFLVYHALLQSYAEFAKFFNKVGNASIYLNQYVKEALLPEIDSLKKWNNTMSLVFLQNTVDASFLLVDTYYSIGEYERSLATLRLVKTKLETVPNWKDSLQRKVSFDFNYYLKTAKSYYATNEYDIADLSIQVAKDYYPKPPVRNDKRYEFWWGNYVLARTYEIDGLFHSNRRQQAIDSMLYYFEMIYETDTSKYPSNKYEPLFLFNVAKMLVAKTKWQMAVVVSDDALKYVDYSSLFDMEYYYNIVAINILANTKNKEQFFKENSLQEVLNYTRHQLQQNIASLSPDQRIIFYENKLLPYFNLYHSLVFEGYLKKFPHLQKQIAEQSIALKNCLLSSDATLQKATANTPYKDLVETNLILKRRATKLENEIALVGSSVHERNKIDLIKDNVLESYFSFLEVNEVQQSFFITEKEINASLGSKDCYVEFVRFNNVCRKDTVFYGAWVLQKQDVAFNAVKLFAEKEIIAVLQNKSSSAQLYALQVKQQRSVTIKNKKDSTATKDNQPLSKVDKLAKLILDSIQRYIQPNGKFIFIPDGYLNRISFAALNYNNSYLFQQVQLKQLSAVSNLLNKKTLPDSLQWLLVGGLAYTSANCDSNKSLLKNMYSWNYLPGSLTEVNTLSAINRSKAITTTVITGNGFADSTLSYYNKSQIIHIASHGFYFDSSEVDTYFSTNFIGVNIKKLPLLRSGIVVSNANCIAKHIPDKNGYLSGYEIAATNLSDCQLIVLSACESALGDIKSNLGVMGLQRAIKLAGAQKMLITLWKIPDAETAEFMQLFYGFLFNQKLTEEASLKKTQEIMSKKYSVSKWGAFVLIE